MKHIVNGFAPVASIADQLARPIVRQRTRLLEPDWESLREFARQLARETRRVTPYVPARVTDEQADYDAAVDGREWCDG
jgi:hypothetical protein